MSLPQAGSEAFNVDGSKTDAYFAIMAATAGISGTLSSGGLIYAVQNRDNMVSETFGFMTVAMVSFLCCKKISFVNEELCKLLKLI